MRQDGRPENLNIFLLLNIFYTCSKYLKQACFKTFSACIQNSGISISKGGAAASSLGGW